MLLLVLKPPLPHFSLYVTLRGSSTNRSFSIFEVFLLESVIASLYNAPSGLNEISISMYQLNCFSELTGLLLGMLLVASC